MKHEIANAATVNASNAFTLQTKREVTDVLRDTCSAIVIA